MRTNPDWMPPHPSNQSCKAPFAISGSTSSKLVARLYFLGPPVICEVLDPGGAKVRLKEIGLGFVTVTVFSWTWARLISAGVRPHSSFPLLKPSPPFIHPSTVAFSSTRITCLSKTLWESLEWPEKNMQLFPLGNNSSWRKKRGFFEEKSQEFLKVEEVTSRFSSNWLGAGPKSKAAWPTRELNSHSQQYITFVPNYASKVVFRSSGLKAVLPSRTLKEDNSALEVCIARRLTKDEVNRSMDAWRMQGNSCLCSWLSMFFTNMLSCEKFKPYIGCSAGLLVLCKPGLRWYCINTHIKNLLYCDLYCISFHSSMLFPRNAKTCSSVKRLRTSSAVTRRLSSSFTHLSCNPKFQLGWPKPWPASVTKLP